MNFTNRELAEAIPDIKPRFQLRRFDELKIGTERTYLVKGLIPRTGLVVVWGPPKCGKSFWTFDLVLHVALGREYRGRRVQQGPVVYCAFEGGGGYPARAEAFRQKYLPEDSAPFDFFLLDAQIDLVKDQPDIVAAIRAQSASPACVVLDTLNRSLAGSESNDKDMAFYIRAADAIREAFGCVVIIVHHCGVDDSRPRGHTSLTGAVDAQLAARRDAAENVLVTVEWMKDGAEGDVIASRLERIEIGTDVDGDAISSCVVVPADSAALAPSVVGRRLSDRQQLALDALNEAVLASGQTPPLEWQLPAGIQMVGVDHWRDELIRRGVIDKTAANPRADFKRLRQSLAARKRIGDRDDYIWPA
jgi:AAA domain